MIPMKLDGRYPTNAWLPDIDEPMEITSISKDIRLAYHRQDAYSGTEPYGNVDDCKTYIRDEFRSQFPSNFERNLKINMREIFVEQISEEQKPDHETIIPDLTHCNDAFFEASDEAAKAVPLYPLLPFGSISIKIGGVETRLTALYQQMEKGPTMPQCAEPYWQIAFGVLEDGGVPKFPTALFLDPSEETWMSRTVTITSPMAMGTRVRETEQKPRAANGFPSLQHFFLSIKEVVNERWFMIPCCCAAILMIIIYLVRFGYRLYRGRKKRLERRRVMVRRQKALESQPHVIPIATMV